MTYWQSQLFKQQGMVAAVSGRAFGQMRWSDTMDPAVPPPGRKGFIEQFGFEAHQLIFPKLVHGSHVERVNDGDIGRGALIKDSMVQDTDGLVTRSNHALLGVSVADCVPVFLYDVSSGAFGVVHAGWRGVVAGVVDEAVAMMSKVWVTNHLELLVAIGPSIRVANYPVGDDVAQIFQAICPEAVVVIDGKPHIDLQLTIKKGLLDIGVPEKNIEDSGICTFAHSKDFFSARAGAPWDGSANLALIGRKDVRVLHHHGHHHVTVEEPV